MLDALKWKPHAHVAKYDDDMVDFARTRSGLLRPDGDTLAALCQPFETLNVPGNLLTTAGLNRITAILIGGSSGTMDATRVRLGVGTSATSETTSDTTLGGSQYFQLMDATYPQQSNGVITLKSTFATGDANFAWACWGLDLGTATVTAGGSANTPLVNRKVAALGTKASGSWVLTVTVTFS